ncbi:MAG TPA: wax ester/triacylglycerol synthase family O-acyltransferase [Acidimicrobiales bacterium]|nr:wax ester/triacylglycerol synthase family O-acyltransferase [Acidimicrobiales bacterium]
MQQLSGLDASFIYSESAHAPTHVTSILIYDQSTAPKGEVTFKGILEYLQDRVHLAHAFRRKLVRVPLDLDHPYWIEDGEFDLEYHVRHIALPKPGDWRQFCIQAARLHARPLDLSRPLWEMYVIEGLDNVEGFPRGCFGIVLKIHHAAIDGMAGVEMITAIHEQSADVSPPPPPGEAWAPERAPSTAELLSRASVNGLARPAHFARVMGRVVPGMGRAAAQMRRGDAAARPAAVPRTRFNGRVTAHRVLDAFTTSITSAKGIKASVSGATINDVVLTVYGGGLRSYLAAKGELPDTSLVAMCPISLRSAEQAKAGGNSVSAMVVPLGTQIADPLERLKFVQSSSHASKAFAEASDARSLSEMSQFIPGGLIGIGMRFSSRFVRLAPAMANTTCTNVPGAREPIYFAGAKCVSSWGAGPVVDGMGLINVITSYCDDLVLAFTACREMIPDPAFYRECLAEAWAELEEATG